MKELKFISPFKKLCITIGNLPTAYIESMSYYEGLTFLVNYLANNVIPAVNNNSEVVKELQDQFVILKNYVDSYFDNLDVQEEINNKLDEMADSGQLTDIIAQYLGLAGMITFDTVADMKAAENLVNGSKCQTLGYHNVNDGGNAIYKIRTVLNTDVIDESFIIALDDDSLIAELIIEDKVNVKQLGVVSDGLTDCSSFVNNAISKYKNIYFPNGEYLISNSIDLLSSDIEIYGETNSIIKNDNNDIFVKSNNQNYINIHDLTFNLSDNNKCAIKYDATVDITTHNNAIRINNCKFFGDSNSTTAIAIYLDGVYNPIITECFFNRVNAIYQEISINALISNCTFRECNYAIHFNGIGATSKSCGDKIIGCDFTECNVGIKAITTDWIDINSCIIDYCLYPIILLGQEYGVISNIYTSAKNGNPVIYINEDVSNLDPYLSGNNSNTKSRSLTISNSFISNNLEIDYDPSNPNLSADNIVVTCKWFNLIDSTVDKYSRNGINLIDCDNVTIKNTRFSKTASYTPSNPVYSIYGETSGNNTNYDAANFKYIGIITGDTISRYLAIMDQTVSSVFVYEKFGFSAIPAGSQSVVINTGLHNPIRNIQLSTSSNTKVYYGGVAGDGSSFTAYISDTFTYPTQISWMVRG